MNRRQFIQLLSASAASVTTMSTTAAEGPGSSLPVHLVHDTAVEIGRSEIRQFLGKVDRFHRISGDVTSLWTDQLDGLWKKQGIITVGVTRHAEYFVLRTLARDHGYTIIKEHSSDDFIIWTIAPDGFQHA